MQYISSKRLFVAIGLDADPSLKELADYLRHNLAYDHINWVNLANIHLTIKFLGETPVSKIDQIIGGLQSVAAINKPFAYTLNKCGVFGSKYDPRVIWVGAKRHPEAIIKLGKDVINSMHELGFERDRQNFVPHLTIARIKRLIDKNHFQQIMQGISEKDYQLLNVHEFTLFESVLKPTGPVYTMLKQFPLSK
jgi:RNA 2',3'-cyclic 3'-phosphodiesterase